MSALQILSRDHAGRRSRVRPLNAGRNTFWYSDSQIKRAPNDHRTRAGTLTARVQSARVVAIAAGEQPICGFPPCQYCLTTVSARATEVGWPSRQVDARFATTGLPTRRCRLAVRDLYATFTAHFSRPRTHGSQAVLAGRETTNGLCTYSSSL